MTPADVRRGLKPILLIGGPWDLDGTEVEDTFESVRVVKDCEGVDHTYYVIRDWQLNRWVGKWQNMRKVAATSKR